MIRKIAAASVVCPVLALFAVEVQCSALQSTRPATLEARGALAEHATKGGPEKSLDTAVELGIKQASLSPRERMNRGISAYMKLLSENGVKKYAATSFLRFYMLRARSVPDVCRAEGVDMSAYSYAFQLKHAAMFRRASDFTNGYRPPAGGMISSEYLDRAEGAAGARRMLSNIAIGLQGSGIVDGCVHLATNEADASSVQSFATEFPELAAVLTIKRATDNGSPRSEKVAAASSSETRVQAGIDSATDPVEADLKVLNHDGAKKYAAAHFFAFYIARTQTEPAVCQAEGVDLTAYVRAFRSMYKVEFARSVELTEGSIFALEQVSSDLLAVREQGATVARRFLADLAASNNKTTVADGCAYLAAHIAGDAAIESFAEKFPELEPILMSD
ncbi:hypothetical protein C8J98_101411 [Luteibacter sp. OK325]|uniref:hypothetical protein n=1 Tax=Luteibacter sp. OK325 TaxID=2135670 RepID=UPI000D399437|nr:hypothetical protein [Luteibacter sp. OK325]PTR35148.1 hypothetical protein C8J98_101411 [Luteibacter sp. OK325]